MILMYERKKVSYRYASILQNSILVTAVIEYGLTKLLLIYVRVF